MSDLGLRARELTEAECGALVDEMWLDFPDTSGVPLLRNAPPDMTECFNEKVAPHYARDRLDF